MPGGSAVQLPKEEDRSLEVFSRGGNTTMRSLEVIELRSSWQKR